MARLPENPEGNELGLQAALLDNIPGCIAMILKKGSREIVASNKLAREVGAVPGRTCFKTFAMRDDACPFCLAPELWTTGQSQRLEVEYRGTWYEGIWAPLSEDLYVHYIFDISDRKQAEEALAESHRLMRTVLEGISDPIFLKDRKNRYILLNTATARGLGRSSIDEVIGTDDTAHIPVETARELQDKDRRVMASGEPEESLETIDVAGSKRFYRTTKSPYHDEEGNVLGVIGIARDITEHKKAEMALESMGQRLELALQAANIGVWDWDLVTNEVYFSPEWKAHIGYAEDELPNVYEEWENRLHPEDREQTLRALRSYQKGQADKYAVEFRLRHKDGSYRWIFARGEMLLDDSGKPVRMNGCHLDITDRKRAEQSLQEAEAELKHTIEVVPGIIATANAHTGYFTHCNPAMSSILGFSSEEFLARPFIEFVHPDDRQSTIDQVEEQLKGSPVAKFENRYICKDGSYKWLEWMATAADEKGVVYAAATDISERKRAVGALLASRERFRQVAEHTQEWIWEVDTEGLYTYSSPVVENILGYSPEEIVGKKHFYDLFHPEQRQEMKNTAFDVFARRESFRGFSNPNIHKNGQTVWLSTSGVPLLNGGGDLVGYRGVDADITARKKNDADLKKQRYFLSRAQEIGSIGTWELDIAKNKLLWTDENYRIFGLPPGTELTYEIFLNCVHPDDREYVDAEWKAAMAGGPYDIEHRLLVDGEVKWGREKAELEFDDEGNCVRGIGFTQDITDRKLAEAELAKHRDHLEELVWERTAVIEAQREQVLEASRLKSEFLATMSHELRTPLNSVMALSQLMLSGGTGKDPDKEAEFLRVIERNGRNLLMLINDILDLSSIEAGRTRVSPSEFALDAVVERVLTVVRPMAQAKALRLEVDLADIPTVYSDRERIGQILLNLLGNAVKFTEAGQITVTASESGGMISLAVADTGIGIGPDVLPHVFDSFRQADGSSTRKYEGTGLGLAISQQLAELLGGQITVTSKVGKGSTFTLRLPVRMADGVQAEGKESTPEAGGTGDVTEATDADLVRSTADRESETEIGAILVVEDNADNLLATTATLEHLGYQCITAVNGELALAAARANAPALILMDIQLPQMDGLEATRRIKADAVLKDIPIVALTAKAMKGDREKILTAGCDDYVSKPVDPAELERVLRKWLG